MTTSSSFRGNGRFELLAELGSGGMGIVYRAFDHGRREPVALKTLLETEPGALLRLKNEFRALQDLQHRNLVSLGELFHEAGQWFFTMELVHGADILSYVRGGGAQPDIVETRLRSCLAQLADGLAVIHAAGRVHRDIKPGNILVEESGRVVLLDFGLVAPAEPRETSTEHFFPVGTVAYMAPEQAASQQVTGAADWYSVGVLLYEALTGKLPHSGPLTKVLLDKQVVTPPRPLELVEGVPADLDDLCMALLQRDPLKRPQAAQVLAVCATTGDELRAPEEDHTAPAVFIGREAELSSLFDAFSDVVAGTPVSILLYGASGLGKSELLLTFRQRLLESEPDAIVLSGRCFERESVPYKAFDGVVDALSQQLQRQSATKVSGLVPDHASLLLRLFPVLARVDSFREASPTRFEVEDLQEVRRLAFQALRELFVRLADRHLVVVTIDDLQWSDEDSKKLLRALTRGPGAPRLLLIGAMRTPGEEDEAERAIASMLDSLSGLPRRLPLGPLSPAESLELAGALVSTDALESGGRLGQIAREAAGHPLFIRELVHHARARSVIGEVLRLDDALWARINQLDEDARRLVEVVAVAGGPLPQAVVRSAADLGQAELFRMAGRLRIARLLRTDGPGSWDAIDTYHDRVREAVIARLAPESLRALHGGLADSMLASENPEPERLTVHLERAGRPVEAAKFAAEAARRADETLAFRRAAELYRRALANWPAPRSDEEHEVVRTLWVGLADALANAGRGPEAADAYKQALTEAPETEALELKRRSAEQLLRSGHVEHGLVAVQEVLGSLGMSLPRTTLGALIGLLWQRFRLRMRGLGFRVQERNEVSSDALIQVDVCNAMSQGLAMADTVRGAYFNTRFVSLALALGERARVARALWMEASYAANTGQRSAYLERLYAAIESLTEAHDPLARAYLDSARGCAEFMDGQWARARQRFQSAEDLFNARGGSVWERTTFRFFIFWCLYYLGELDELTRRILPLHADAVDRGDRYAASGMFLGLVNIAHLNALGSVETRARIRELTTPWQSDRYYLRDYYALLAETQVDLYEGKGSDALRRLRANWPGLKSSLLLMVPSVRIEANHLRARAALSAAKEDASRDALREAHAHIRRLEREKAGWAHALAGPLRAAWLWREGRREVAITALRDAVRALDEREMRLYAAAARHRLGEMTGDEGELASARSFLASQRVSEPERIVDMLVPGFD